jgi:hypothetical protein
MPEVANIPKVAEVAEVAEALPPPDVGSRR